MKKLNELFLSQPEYDIQDFLQQVEFIPPKNMSVQYFISPNEIKTPQGQPITKEPYSDDDSVKYSFTPPSSKIDQQEAPADYSLFKAPKLDRRIPTPNILPPVTIPEDLECPFVKIISESATLGSDILLENDFGPFKQGTVFHCIRKKIKD